MEHSDNQPGTPPHYNTLCSVTQSTMHQTIGSNLFLTQVNIAARIKMATECLLTSFINETLRLKWIYSAGIFSSFNKFCPWILPLSFWCLLRVRKNDWWWWFSGISPGSWTAVRSVLCLLHMGPKDKQPPLEFQPRAHRPCKSLECWAKENMSNEDSIV